MMYFGGKQRVAKDLHSVLNNFLIGNNKTFVDLFCGSCNVLVGVDKDRSVIANDKHKYLISMWREVQNGWIPPVNLSKNEYVEIKENIDQKPYLSGFVGFGCSYSGKWFGGYAKNKDNRNYCKNAHNSTMKKAKDIVGVIFENKDYSEVSIPNGSVVYCDIPYKNTTQYSKSEVGTFSHDEFYEWVNENKDKFEIYISEYKHNVPNGFDIVWEKGSCQDIRNKTGKKNKTVEVLMTPRK